MVRQIYVKRVQGQARSKLYPPQDLMATAEIPDSDW
jgi:hypothetical protein